MQGSILLKKERDILVYVFGSVIAVKSLNGFTELGLRIARNFV